MKDIILIWLISRVLACIIHQSSLHNHFCQSEMEREAGRFALNNIIYIDMWFLMHCSKTLCKISRVRQQGICELSHYIAHRTDKNGYPNEENSGDFLFLYEPTHEIWDYNREIWSSELLDLGLRSGDLAAKSGRPEKQFGRPPAKSGRPLVLQQRLSRKSGRLFTRFGRPLWKKW